MDKIFFAWCKYNFRSSILKMKSYEGCKQYNSKADQGKAIQTTMSEAESTKVKNKLTKSIDNRLLAFIEKKGHYMKR